LTGAELQVRTRQVVVTMAVSSSLLLLSLSCQDAVVRKRVAGVDFCVPRINYVDTDYPWIPRDLPQGEGFGFSIGDFFAEHPEFDPLRDISGRKMGLGGGVTTSQKYVNWDKPRPGTYTFKQAARPISSTEQVSGSYLSIYTTPSRDSWDVWEVPSIQKADDIVAKAGRLVATCRKFGQSIPNARVGTSCSRYLIVETIALHYWFAYENLSRLGALDGAVKIAILSWRCGGSGGGS
jgi:hypothetical protein